MPVDTRDLSVELSHQGDEGLVRHTMAASHVVCVQERPVADEGIGFGIATGELDGAGVELAS